MLQLPWDFPKISTPDVEPATTEADTIEFSIAVPSAANVPTTLRLPMAIAALMTLLHRYAQADGVAVAVRRSLAPEAAWHPIALALTEDTTLQRLVADITEQGFSEPKLTTPDQNVLLTVGAAEDEFQTPEPSMEVAERYGADLHWILNPNGGQWTGKLVYAPHLFRPETLQRMIGHFEQLAQGMLAQPQQAVLTLPMLTPTELQQQRQDWQSEPATYPQEPIFRAFEAQVAERPGAIALRFQRQALTYAELNQRANQLAHYLMQHGVRDGATVVSCFEPCPGAIVGLLAIFKAGGTYVPVDPSYPRGRLSLILSDVQPKVLLTQSHLLAAFGELSLPTLCPDQDWSLLSDYPSHNPAQSVDLSQTAYIIYTSGTTGTPKGVMASHANLVNYIWSAHHTYRFNADDVMPAIARFTFSITMFELWSPLVAGGELLLLEREHILDFRRMVKTLQKITVLHASPSLLRKLVAYIQDNADTLPPQTFQNLRHVSSGGDMVPADLLANLKAIFEQAEIYVIYGCSEISCMGCTYFVPRNTPETVARVGKPFPNVTMHLYDAYQNPVPIGIPGEIYFGGAGINQGYLHQPDLTAEKFVEIEGDRFYRTGDIGRLDADGNLEMLGRSDFQIKLRGIRMEPGEIEATLRKVPGVRDAVVAARTLPGQDDKSLVAYLVLEEEDPPSTPQIRQFLRKMLPDYMVPSFYMTLPALPLNINGKVDRKRLPLPALNVSDTHPSEMADSDLESQLVRIWESVLPVRPIGIHDNFFDLGGDSLSAAQVIYRVQALTQQDVPVSQIFVHPTIANLAASLQQLTDAASNVQTSITCIPHDAYLPLSLPQERLWFLAQLEEGIAYNIPLAFDLDGLLNVSVLQACLTEIVRRHEALRTTFVAIDGIPKQAILPAQSVPLPVVDLQTLPQDEQAADVQRLIQQEAQRPFHLATDLPIRFTLLKLDPTHHIFLLTVHHLVADGWSLNLMRQEVAALYPAFLAGQGSPLPDLPFQYADFAHWHRSWVDSPTVQNQLDYWKQQLASLPPLLELPTDHPRPPVQGYRGGTEFFTLDAELTQHLKALSQRAGATLFMTLLAAFSTLLSRYSKHEDLAIGSPIANRNRSDIESLVGFFINLLVMRVDLSGNPGFLDLVRRVRQVALDAYAHQDVPFDQLVEALQPNRNLSHSPLFQVMFILQNSPLAEDDLSGLSLSARKVESGTAKYDLTLMMEEADGQLTAELEFNRDLFDRETIVRMVGHFRTLLAGLVADPDRPIATLPLLTEPERHQLLTTWNDTALAYPPEACIHQLFESQAERTPGAIALTFGDQSMTYGELNQRASQVAHYLQTLGVGPEGLVGICVERSLDMVVGLLGILKAGGSYVPLDPAYPMDRLTYMIEHSQLPILLTQQAFCEQFADQGVQLVCLDADWGAIAQHPTHTPSSGVTGDNLAYTIYTSGSTGKPKGVQILHRTTVNFLNGMGHKPGLTQSDVLLAVTTISFDIAVLELYLPLMVGAQVVIATREDAANATQLMALLTQHNVTVLQATPVTWQMLIANGWQGDGRLKMLCGGEAMPRAMADQLLERGGSLWNMYGPTETTVWSAACQVGPGTGTVPVADPIANTQIYVLDARPELAGDLQLLPIGVPGEVFIGGDGLARGYLNRPDLTAERFIPDPFGDRPDARLYRTGDLARFRPDGSLEFLGRIDNQVKLRGFRIELGEIEAVLTQYPAVKQGAVIVREEAPGDKRLVAYYTAQLPDHPPTVKELRAFLQKHLPNYMVPTAFVGLETMPLTPNGKIDRRSLPKPEGTEGDRPDDYIPPRTKLERQLVAIWESVLKVSPVSINANFFELGGNSLLSVQILTEIEKTFGKALPLSTFLQAPAIEALATVLRNTEGIVQDSGLVPLRETGSKPPLFCLYGVLLYRELMKQLPPDQPVYGVYLEEEVEILKSGKAQSHANFNSVPAIAQQYIKTIQSAQPHGPYFLIGESFGGIVAYEMAQQLKAAGESVELVGLLDSIAPNTTVAFESIKHRLKKHLDLTFQRGPSYLVSKIHKALHHKIQDACQTQLADAPDASTAQVPGIQDSVKEEALPDIRQNVRHEILRGYHVQPFDGSVILFRAEQRDQFEYDPNQDCGWSEFASNLKVISVPGNHLGILQTPNVEILADQLKSYLE